ncbi:signal peptide prediction [Piscinibacter sp.]|uniref:signal peptide prediction n=1 Tax=Piscinibacter sp. TaxID=1903157 RepID=UPI002C1E49AD|nr:signal peptide prediction [Albitalea sp.]HUG24062.1 signal peptide prediction [Albitalea sp.]
MTVFRAALRGWRYAWAAPCSAVGLLLGLVAWLCGATVRVRAGALEFGGGRAGALASRLPAPCTFSAITFGHVILGTDHVTLTAARTHEQVHVRQYERWGLLFFPAYLLSSAAQMIRGRDPYLDNRFEREARALAAGAPSRPTC